MVVLVGWGSFANERDERQSLPEKRTEALELSWLLHLGQPMFLLQSQGGILATYSCFLASPRVSKVEATMATVVGSANSFHSCKYL